MATPRLISRGGSGGFSPSTSSYGGQQSSSHLCCNRCRSNLSTTVFICACDCVFCEECTYSHFNSSSNCPGCGKMLSADDFMELCVADPSAVTQEVTKNTFQNILTKFSSSTNSLTHQEMCSRLLKNLDNDRRAVRFLLKQFIFESSSQDQQSGSIGRAYEQLKLEHTQLKQAASSQRIQLEQTIADLNHRVQALKGTQEELQKKLMEKENQLAHFRQLYANEGSARRPSSGSSHSSGGKHGRINHTPPIPGFLIQKEVRERAKEHTLGHMARSHPFGQTSTESVITPIQLPSPRIHPGASRGQIPSTPRIRDLSSSSGYVFTSRSSSNATRGHPSTSGYGAANSSRYSNQPTYGRR